MDPSSSGMDGSIVTSHHVTSSQRVTPVIGFLDVDSFECQIWQREQPQTRGKPCVVAIKSGRIVAATYEAKSMGVSRSRSEIPNLKAAQDKCDGNLVVFQKHDKWGKQDQSKLRKATAELVTHTRAFLKEFWSEEDVTLEVASNDEFYLDISAQVCREMEQREEKLFGQSVPGFPIPPNIVWERHSETKEGSFFYRLSAEQNKNQLDERKTDYYKNIKNEEKLMFGAVLLSQLCEYLEQKTGLQMSGGVAQNKLLAKVGCGLNKPRKITVFCKEACPRVYKLVDLSSIPGLGGATGEKMKETFGISKVGDILGVPQKDLEQTFGRERATRFMSWALGYDVEPVLPKIRKSYIRCNKSAGDIKTLTALKLVLRNLTSEIFMLLQEEGVRYGRKATQVKVEYKLGVGAEQLSEETNSLESQIFDIEPLSRLNDLYENALNYLRSLPIFSDHDLHFTELAFVLKNFTQIKPTKGCKTSFVSNCLKMLPSTELPVHIHGNLCDTQQLPQFHHSIVGSFRITTNLNYSTGNTYIPKLLNESDLQSLAGYDLLRDFPSNVSCLKLRTDNTYDELKHEFFSKWLLEEKRGNQALNNIKFVTFQEGLIESFKTILNSTCEEWETYAMNVDGIIYLWNEKSPKTKFTFPEGSYMEELFEQIVSGRGPSTEGVLDGFRKVFPIQKVKFGSHNLLLLNTIDAQEIHDGGFVQVQLQMDENCFKVKNPSFLLERNLKLWSQAVVSGSNKVVIGHKNFENCITKIQSISVDELSSSVEDNEKCFVFLDHLLEWISAHLPFHNDELVKKFSWIPGQIHVTCTTIPHADVEKLLLPKIYFPKKLK